MRTFKLKLTEKFVYYNNEILRGTFYIKTNVNLPQSFRFSLVFLAENGKCKTFTEIAKIRLFDTQGSDDTKKRLRQA